MRRGAKPPKGKAKLAVARKSPENEGSRVRDLEKRLAEALDELQTRDRELVEAREQLTAAHAQVSESHEQQTATSEILRVISSSPTEIEPVLDRMAESAARYCQAYDATIFRVEDDDLRLVAHHGPISSLPIGIVIPLTPGGVATRSVLERRPIHVADIQLEEQEFPVAAVNARRLGNRTMLAVPLLREDRALGAILLRRTEVQPFTDKQIALLQTFADQAVIAIENVRLFKELETRNRDLTEALDRQTATAEILRVISQSQTEVQPVFEAIADSAMRLFRAWSALVFRYDGELLSLAAARGGLPGSSGSFLARFQAPRSPDDDTIHGRTVITRAVQHIADVEADAYRNHHVRRSASERGFRSVVWVPMLRGNEAVGAIGVSRVQSGGFSDAEIALLQTFADQAVIAIENVRLFKELEAANRELAAASQHKSEFLANMSHELRTPLNAIIGFSEVLGERMFGELNDKQDEYLKDIHASGQHLLSLINDILDLSKIEAGRMELELTDFDLPTAIENALTLVRERAGRRGIALHQIVDQQLGQVRADERKIKQVLLNLLSNALKFTPEGGRVDVRAGLVNGLAEISVADTGVGIAPDDQEAIFEEFRQVGTAAKKVEGTGLGLALSRKFVELHGGRIWVESQVGVGSTFTFTIPIRTSA
jgi:signal transduction histidine kinase